MTLPLLLYIATVLSTTFCLIVLNNLKIMFDHCTLLLFSMFLLSFTWQVNNDFFKRALQS